jgi:glycosyltransferase involved in cell wall biosynthesis
MAAQTAAVAISVVLTTYNHGPYVEQALLSVLEQRSSVPLELVWHDDASTDDTVARVERLLAGHPMPVKRLLRSHNRMGQGVPMHMDLLQACSGECLALLEGDDAWTSPDKLQLQWQALQQHAGLDLCFHRAQVLRAGPEAGAPHDLMADLGPTPGQLALSTVIRGDGGFMPSSALLVRKNALLNAPRWFFALQPVGDYLFQVQGSRRGGALYLPHVLSLYRSQAVGSWSEGQQRSPAARAQFHAGFIATLRQMQAEMGAATRADFDDLIARHFAELARLSLAHHQAPALVRAATALLD